MAFNVFLLLPPSEGKAVGGRATRSRDYFADDLADTRGRVQAALTNELRTGSSDHHARIFKARGALLERAESANAAASENAGPWLAAWRRYEGIVWNHLDPATLSTAVRRRILVPSGLYGVNLGTDDIADYRLSMNVSLNGLGPLATLWRPVLTEVLVARCRLGVVVNLATKENLAAIDLGLVGDVARVIDVRFVDHTGDKAVGHDAKAVKGTLARAVAMEGLDVTTSFSWGGWNAIRNGDVVEVRAPKERVLSPAPRAKPATRSTRS